jgi:hypothetical protein
MSAIGSLFMEGDTEVFSEESDGIHLDSLSDDDL